MLPASRHSQVSQPPPPSHLVCLLALHLFTPRSLPFRCPTSPSTPTPNFSTSWHFLCSHISQHCLPVRTPFLCSFHPPETSLFSSNSHHTRASIFPLHALLVSDRLSDTLVPYPSSALSLVSPASRILADQYCLTPQPLPNPALPPPLRRTYVPSHLVPLDLAKAWLRDKTTHCAPPRAHQQSTHITANIQQCLSSPKLSTPTLAHFLLNFLPRQPLEPGSGPKATPAASFGHLPSTHLHLLSNQVTSIFDLGISHPPFNSLQHRPLRQPLTNSSDTSPSANMSRYLVVPSFDGPSDTRSRSGSHHSQGSQGAQSHSRHPSQGGGSQSHVSGSHVSASPGGGARAGGSSRPPSNVGAASGPTGYPQALGYDPGRDEKPLSPEEEHRIHVGKRVDLPAEAFVDVSHMLHENLTRCLMLTLSNRPVLDTPLPSGRSWAQPASRLTSVSTNSESWACPASTSTSTT